MKFLMNALKKLFGGTPRADADADAQGGSGSGRQAPAQGVPSQQLAPLTVPSQNLPGQPSRAAKVAAAPDVATPPPGPTEAPAPVADPVPATDSAVPMALPPASSAAVAAEEAPTSPPPATSNPAPTMENSQMSTDNSPTGPGDGNSGSASPQGSGAPAAAGGGSGGGASPPKSALATMTAKMGPPSSTPPATDALNSQIVQAVQLTNAENAAYGPNQVALAPNMMITQASGLVAQSAAAYFDGASKMVLASKSVLLKDMTEKFAEENLKGAAEDALGILITDLLMGTAAAVAAAAGAIEAESAHFSLDKIDQSIEKYHSTLGNKS